jgi:hypothetical protein
MPLVLLLDLSWLIPVYFLIRFFIASNAMFDVLLSLVYFGSGAFIAYNPAVLQSISSLWSRANAAAVGNQSEVRMGPS